MTPVSVQAAAASVLQVSEPTFLAYSRMLSNKPQDGRGLVDQANGYFPQAADVTSQNDTHYTALHTPSCTYPFPPVPRSGPLSVLLPLSILEEHYHSLQIRQSLP